MKFWQKQVGTFFGPPCNYMYLQSW